MPLCCWVRPAVLALAMPATLLCGTLQAQTHGSAGGSGPPPGNGMPERGMSGDRFPGGPPGFPPPGGPDRHGPGSSTMRGGLQLGPPGRWWDDSGFAKELHLSHDQQTRMDAIFESNRTNLFSHFQALRQEEFAMESLTHVAEPSEAALFAQIDRIAQARAELEKANTHYLLALRREMTPEQIAKLDEHR